MVGLAVLARVAPIILASGPSLASTCGAAAGVNSRPSASLAASRNACAEGMSRVGHSWRPIRATVSASSVTALSLWSREPCPAVPRAVSRSHARPFSAVSTRLRPSPAAVALHPADLADRLGAPLEQVRVVLPQPPRAPVPAGLLVGQEGEHHVARRPTALPHPLPDHGQ